MKFATLYWIYEKGNSEPYLSSHKDAGDSFEPAKREEMTAGAIAEFLDQQAENDNRHDFASAHVALANILADEVDEDTADAIMVKILNRGGLWES